MTKITVDAKWSANTRGEIEYDYIKIQENIIKHTIKHYTIII